MVAPSPLRRPSPVDDAALRSPATKQLFDKDIVALSAVYHNARKTGALYTSGRTRITVTEAQEQAGETVDMGVQMLQLSGR